ncbi:unnamed protein product [Caenorhabditis bovis]|uniref:MARVEL domain-containing protein n=1 Tax=Caenorhabditis bovis TaxID=2654633 RepID=A0A8S1EZH0_9PELO|nr:unnamed protein product [Caenorhabditis bovis]
MGYQEMKTMPHLLKPVLLLLTLLQIIFMASPGARGFFWFVCLTSILEFLVAIANFAANFLDLMFTSSSQYIVIELAASGIFCVCSALNTIYYFVNIFYKFNFWFLLATADSVFLVLAYGLQALLNWSARGIASSSNNQATAMPPPGSATAYPAGVNPA